MASNNQYFSTSLEKGLKILSLFNEQTPSLTQTEISRTLDLNMTSTYRFVNTLVRLGYLEKDEKTKELRLGLKALALGSNILRAADELRLIKGLVDRVHDERNITIDVVFAMDDSLVIVYRREAEETMIYRLPAVARDSMHNTSVGKAYLSTLPDDELERVIEAMPLEAKTERTITSKDELRREIEEVRRRGYAMCEEEYVPGLITIGAPLISRAAGRGVGGVSFDFSIIEHNAKQVEKKYAGLIVELGRAVSDVLHGEETGR